MWVGQLPEINHMCQGSGQTMEMNCADSTFPVNTKHLYNICTVLDQRRSRWGDVVHILYKCSVLSGLMPLNADILLYKL